MDEWIKYMNPVPVGKRREKQKVRTREIILNSMRTLLEKKGYDNTTMRAVAAHAEIGIGTIYKHFSNKRALFDKALVSIPTDQPFKRQFLHKAL